MLLWLGCWWYELQRWSVASDLLSLLSVVWAPKVIRCVCLLVLAWTKMQHNVVRSQTCHGIVGGWCSLVMRGVMMHMHANLFSFHSLSAGHSLDLKRVNTHPTLSTCLRHDGGTICPSSFVVLSLFYPRPFFGLFAGSPGKGAEHPISLWPACALPFSPFLSFIFFFACLQGALRKELNFPEAYDLPVLYHSPLFFQSFSFLPVCREPWGRSWTSQKPTTYLCLTILPFSFNHFFFAYLQGALRKELDIPEAYDLPVPPHQVQQQQYQQVGRARVGRLIDVEWVSDIN